MTNNKQIKAILFDMDGTLVNTEPIGPQVMRRFLNHQKINPTQKEWILFDKVWRRDRTKITFEKFMTDIFKKYAPTKNIDKIIADFFHSYEKALLTAKPLPGVNKALLYLKNKYKLALVTASTTEQAIIILKNNHWKSHFDLIVSHDDYSKSKPNPESYLLAAKKLKTPPVKCIVIEDSKNGSLSGKNAGMHVIGVRAGNKHKQNLSSADIIVETMIELQKTL